MRFCNTIQPSWQGAWAASKCLTTLQSQAREAVSQQETGTEHPQALEEDKSGKKENGRIQQREVQCLSPYTQLLFPNKKLQCTLKTLAV